MPKRRNTARKSARRSARRVSRRVSRKVSRSAKKSGRVTRGSARRSARRVSRRARRNTRRNVRRNVRRVRRSVRRMRGGGDPSDATSSDNVIIMFTDHPEEADDACAILNLCAWAKEGTNKLIICYGGKNAEKWVSQPKQDVGVPELLTGVVDGVHFINLCGRENYETKIQPQITAYKLSSYRIHILITGPCNGVNKYDVPPGTATNLIANGGEVLKKLNENGNIESLFIQGEPFNVPSKTDGWGEAVDVVRNTLRKKRGARVFDGVILPGGYDKETGLKWPVLPDPDPKNRDNEDLSKSIYELLEQNKSALKSILGFYTRCCTTSPPHWHTQTSQSPGPSKGSPANSAIPWCQVSVARPATEGNVIEARILNTDEGSWSETTNHITAGYIASKFGCPPIDFGDILSNDAHDGVKLSEYPKLQDDSKPGWMYLYDKSLKDKVVLSDKTLIQNIIDLGEFLIHTSREFAFLNTKSDNISIFGETAAEEIELYGITVEAAQDVLQTTELAASESSRPQGFSIQMKESFLGGAGSFSGAASTVIPYATPTWREQNQDFLDWLYARAGILWWWRCWIAAAANNPEDTANVELSAKVLLENLKNNCLLPVIPKDYKKLLEDIPAAGKAPAFPGGWPAVATKHPYFTGRCHPGSKSILPCPSNYYDDNDDTSGSDTSFKDHGAIKTALDTLVMQGLDGFHKIPTFLMEKFNAGTLKLNSLLPHLGDLSVSFIIMDYLQNQNPKDLITKISANKYGPDVENARELMVKFKGNLMTLSPATKAMADAARGWTAAAQRL
jgi:hypothetical protein